jgi:integrase/recombinase XerD
MIMAQKFRNPYRQVQKGSFSAFVQVFVEQLRDQGYTAASVKISTRLVTDFTAWLDQCEIKGQSLSGTLVADYLDDRWLKRRRRRGDAFTLHAFVRLVAPDGYKASSEHEAAIAPAHRVRQDFERYLRCERGLAEASIRLYGDAVGRFLEHAFGVEDVRLGALAATDVVRFVQTEAARLNHAKRAKVMTSALRSFLRYGRYHGEIAADLHSCVPTVANWSMAGLPTDDIGRAGEESYLPGAIDEVPVGRRGLRDAGVDGTTRTACQRSGRTDAG